MQIKRQTDQSIRILVHLAIKRQIMVGKELAGLVGVSEKYLPHIMQQLRRAGLVSSSSGTSGGYVLAKSAKKITLLDVMVATADEPQISCYAENEREACLFGPSDALLKNYDFMQEIATHYFSSLTIWDLTKSDRLNAFYSMMDHLISVIADENNISLPGRQERNNEK